MSGSEWKREGLDQANLEEAMRELAHWRDRGLALRDRINTFFDLELRFCKALSGSGETPSLKLVTPAVRNMVKQTAKHPAVILPFFGSNSCGKSTLLNSLLGANVMPTGIGHVTGRICAISYAELSVACIDTTTLEQFQTEDCTPIASHPLGNLSIDEVQSELRRHLKRPDVLPPDWVQQVVHLRYPFELLRSGVMLVDLPGTSKSDDCGVQQQIQDFFTSVRPAGVCFLYKSPSFSDDAIAALKLLKNALAMTKDANLSPEIFFVSTQLDLEDILFNHGNVDGDLNLLLQQLKGVKSDRWDSLQKAKKTAAFGQDLTTVQQSTFENDFYFGVANAFDYMTPCEFEKPEERKAVECVFGEFRCRLFAFAVLVQRVRYEAVYQRLLDGSDWFFRLLNDQKSKDKPKLALEALAAKEAVSGLEKALIDATTSAILSIQMRRYETLGDHQPSIWTEVDKATRKFDSSKLDEKRDQCLADMKNAVSKYFEENLIPDILKQIDAAVGEAVTKVIQERLASMNTNLMLGAALRNSISVGSIRFRSVGIVGSILQGLRSTLITYQSSRALVSVARSFLDLFFGPTQSTPLYIDENWRKTSQTTMAADLIDAIDIQSLINTATQQIKQFTTKVTQEIDDRCEAAIHSLQLFADAQDLLPDMRLKFATYECECWVELRTLEGELGSLEFEEQPVLSASSPSVESNATATNTEENINSNLRLSYATWKTKQGEKRVLVKGLPRNAPTKTRISFLEDAHYSLHIRRVSDASLVPPTLLPALAIHRDTHQQSPTSSTNQLAPLTSSSSNTQLSDYVLIYDNVMGDLETLLSTPLSSSHPTRLAAPSPLDRIYFCLQAALGVESLHKYGVTHRKVTPRALWYRIVDGQYAVYLTDLSAATMSTANYEQGTDTQAAATKSQFWDWEPPEIDKAAKFFNLVTSSDSMRSSSRSVSSSSSSWSLRWSGRANVAPSSGSAYSRECDIWMLGKTIQWIMDGGVWENDLKMKEKNALSSLHAQSNAVYGSTAIAHDWHELVRKMLQDDPTARPTAAQVVDALNALIKHYPQPN